MEFCFLQIQFDSSNFWTINWYYFVAVFFSIIGITIAYKNYKKKPQEKKEASNSMINTQTVSNTNNIPININNHIPPYESSKNISPSWSSTSNNREESMKATTRILFVDDNHSEYKIVSILKKAGWIKTKSVRDITDLDSTSVNEADIIFVDINGVGLELFEDQGLGLASALKKKYPSKKIVIYSAETTGDRFHQALREVDHCLPKNADAYQFINLIENLIRG